jgi:hypothetical protein
MKENYPYFEEIVADEGGNNTLLRVDRIPDWCADLAGDFLYLALRVGEIIGAVIGVAVFAVAIVLTAVFDFVFG